MTDFLGMATSPLAQIKDTRGVRGFTMNLPYNILQFFGNEMFDTGTHSSKCIHAKLRSVFLS